jgi:tetratricopeptide (TPR) repeat protein
MDIQPRDRVDLAEVEDASVERPGRLIDTIAWLGESPPPPALVSHLGSRCLALVPAAEQAILPPARLITLEAMASSARVPHVEGRRIAVLQKDPSNAEALSRGLRARGGEVLLLSLDERSLGRAEALDPDVILLDMADFTGDGLDIVRNAWERPRLCFAPVLLLPHGSLHADESEALDLPRICGAIHDLSAEYSQLVTAAQNQQEFSLGLDRLGPVRMLRGLLEAGRPLRARIDAGAHTLHVAVAPSLIVGALGGPHGFSDENAPWEAPLLGAEVLAMLVRLTEGEVIVRSVVRPAVTNIMSPLDAALNAALKERTVGFESGELTPTSRAKAEEARVRRAFDNTLLGPAARQKPTPASGTALGEPEARFTLAPPGVTQADVELASPTLRSRQRRKVGALALLPLLIVAGWFASHLAFAKRDQASHALAAAPAQQAALPRAASQPDAAEEELAEQSEGAQLLGESRQARLAQAAQLTSQGNLFLERGLSRTARARYSEALRASPDYPRAIAGMARLEIAAGRGDLAVPHALRLVHMRPAVLPYRVLLGDAYESANMHDKAVAAWTKAARRGSKAAKARLKANAQKALTPQP